MRYVTVYYQGHKVEYMPAHTGFTRRWLVNQGDEQFLVKEVAGARRGVNEYDLYSPGNGDWRIQEMSIPSLDAVARVICDTVYV